MSPRPKKTPGNDVVAVEDIAEVEVQDPSPEQIEEAEDFLSEPVNQQEFNEFITQLAQNAAQQEIADLDERVRDLERLVSVLIGATGATNPDPSARPVVVQDSEPADVPDYSRAHQQDDGVPWYRGD